MCIFTCPFDSMCCYWKTHCSNTGLLNMLILMLQNPKNVSKKYSLPGKVIQRSVLLDLKIKESHCFENNTLSIRCSHYISQTHWQHVVFCNTVHFNGSFFNLTCICTLFSICFFSVKENVLKKTQHTFDVYYCCTLLWMPCIAILLRFQEKHTRDFMLVKLNWRSTLTLLNPLIYMPIKRASY